MDKLKHIPVLLDDVIGLLEPGAKKVVVDCTLGLGGHAKKIIPLLNSGSSYIALDVDRDNIKYSKSALQPIANSNEIALEINKANFRDLPYVLGDKYLGKVDFLLADLGFASSQMDDPKRGFSFLNEGPLDMRLDSEIPVTAQDLVNQMGQMELADLLFNYGEEKLSRKIAKKIVELRQKKPIKTTKELSAIVSDVYKSAGFFKSKVNPATKTFMALRIAVNGELEALDELLTALPAVLASGGRAAIISFHSLEDRRVKQKFCSFAKNLGWKRKTSKPLIAKEKEIEKNPRSRSAKLRVIDQVAGD